MIGTLEDLLQLLLTLPDVHVLAWHGEDETTRQSVETQVLLEVADVMVNVGNRLSFGQGTHSVLAIWEAQLYVDGVLQLVDVVICKGDLLLQLWLLLFTHHICQTLLLYPLFGLGRFIKVDWFPSFHHEVVFLVLPLPQHPILLHLLLALLTRAPQSRHHLVLALGHVLPPHILHQLLKPTDIPNADIGQYLHPQRRLHLVVPLVHPQHYQAVPVLFFVDEPAHEGVHVPVELSRVEAVVDHVHVHDLGYGNALVDLPDVGVAQVVLHVLVQVGAGRRALGQEEGVDGQQGLGLEHVGKSLLEITLEDDVELQLHELGEVGHEVELIIHLLDLDLVGLLVSDLLLPFDLRPIENIQVLLLELPNAGLLDLTGRGQWLHLFGVVGRIGADLLDALGVRQQPPRCPFDVEVADDEGLGHLLEGQRQVLGQFLHLFAILWPQLQAFHPNNKQC